MGGSGGSDVTYDKLSLRLGSVLEVLLVMKVSYRSGAEEKSGAALYN